MNRTPRAPQCLLAAMAILLNIFGASAMADDKLLEETVNFTGMVLFLQSRVPALVIGVVRDGKTAVFGFGETSDGFGKAPDKTHHASRGLTHQSLHRTGSCEPRRRRDGQIHRPTAGSPWLGRTRYPSAVRMRSD